MAVIYMKYVVICYSIHNKKITGTNPFINREDACTYLEGDIWSTYEEKKCCGDLHSDHINFNIDTNGVSYLSSCDGAYHWTWEIIEVE